METVPSTDDTAENQFGYGERFSELYDTIALAGYYDYEKLVTDLISLIPDLNPRSEILEIGVGTGNFALAMHAQGFTEITGIDNSKYMIDQLNTKQADETKITAIHQDGFNFAIKKDFELVKFDLVVINGGNIVFIDDGDESLHFEILTDNPENLTTLLSSVNKHLANGGYFAVNVQKPHDENHSSLELPNDLQYSNTIRTVSDGILKTHTVKNTSGKILAQETMHHIILPWDVYQKIGFLKNHLDIATVDLEKGWLVFRKNMGKEF